MAASLKLPARIRGALLGLAVTDALGAPVEFQVRDTFPLVTTMQPNHNFGLPAGCFTDDTSMALCLAYSLLENGKDDNADQARRYIKWWREGWMSSVGRCFDVGVGTVGALKRWERLLEEGKGVERCLEVIEEGWGGERCCGNGGLMRCLPVALLFGRDEVEGVVVGMSRVTHPHRRCLLAVRLYVRLVVGVLEGWGMEEVARAVGVFVEEGKGEERVDGEFARRFEGYKTLEKWKSKGEGEISSSGYVLDSLEAALWAFFTTGSFREGTIKVVNLGDDADTVGAIFGGLAGAYYGEEAIPEDWLKEMKRLDLVEDVAQQIVKRRVGGD